MNHRSSNVKNHINISCLIVLLSFSPCVLAADNIFSDTPWISILIAILSVAALVISVWAVLLGLKSIKKDREFVNHLKKTIETDQQYIDKTLHTIKANEERAEELVEQLTHKNNALMSKQHNAWTSAEKIQALTDRAEEAETNLRHKNLLLEKRIEQTQDIWDKRLVETEKTVIKVEQELRENLNHLDIGIKRIQQQDVHSYQLAQHVTAQHHIQLDKLDANNTLTEQVRSSLDQTLKESATLLEQLQSHRDNAETIYKKYINNMDENEDDLYNQYDGAFQNIDMARQELNANVDESRLHIESLRRYEKQSRYIKETTENNLKQLDVQSINQLINTLGMTQQTFKALSHKVSEAQLALESLNNINLSQTKGQDSHNPETTHYQDPTEINTPSVTTSTKRDA